MVTSAQRDRLAAAFAQFDAAEMNAAVAELGDGEHLTNLAQVLNVKKPALRAHPEPAALVRGRLRSGAPGRAVLTALEIAGPCADACIDDLGDERSEDPTLDDMREVLPPLVEEFGAKIVTLMLAAYVAMDAPCAAVFDELLDTDERFAIGPAAAHDVDAVTPEVAPVASSREPDPEVAAKRARRKEADERKRAAAQRQREVAAAAAAKRKAARKHRTH